MLLSSTVTLAPEAERSSTTQARAAKPPSSVIQPGWRSVAHNPFGMGWSASRFRQYPAEAIVSDWRLPIVAAPVIDGPVRAVSTSVEGRYRIRPGLYAAARLDHLAFSTVVGTTRRDEWDAPVTRLEIGGGYSLMRNLVLKLAWQRNTRDTTRTPSRTFVAAQAVFWF